MKRVITYGTFLQMSLIGKKNIKKHILPMSNENSF